MGHTTNLHLGKGQMEKREEVIGVGKRAGGVEESITGMHTAHA